MKSIKKECDTLWSKLIKEKAGNKCEYCGNPSHLNSHHIFSRSNNSVRFDPDNGIALCPLHHTLGKFSAHKSSLLFAEWIKLNRGDNWYERLKYRALSVSKLDYKLVKIFLQEELKKL